MCKLCDLKPVYVFTNSRKVCKSCYLRWFSKKSLYTIRKFRMIKKGDVVGYKKSSDFRLAVLKDVLNLYSEKSFCKIVEFSAGKKIQKIALVSTTDLVARDVISSILKSDLNKIKIKPVEGKFIRPLYFFTDKEVLLYAEIKGLNFIKKKNKKSILDDLEAKHPEIKMAVVSSYLKLD